MSKTYGLTLNGLATNGFSQEIKWSSTSIKITGITFGSNDAIYRFTLIGLKRSKGSEDRSADGVTGV
ncbi:hypothetical protein HOLleu_22972 [Holothuria leucospilota]|uniref:Uncharacterized protein n=1 Tax=Holothuria leucospilota TaxID=206669 RepID=A0A9Q1H4T6_HOLLE|nr:hypothetical protein HOLleu_22972 [Holothuria leucospilota]